MMLVTAALSPASCAAMLPQKFSAATTVSRPLPRPPAPSEEGRERAPLQAVTPAMATSAAERATRRLVDLTGDMTPLVDSIDECPPPHLIVSVASGRKPTTRTRPSLIPRPGPPHGYAPAVHVPVA